MKAIIISAVILCVLIWWLAIYFFGIWGIVGCLTGALSYYLYIKNK